MSRKHIFADEAGNFDFSLHPSASRFFILGTATMTDLSVGHDLTELRRNLAFQGVGLESAFHAAEDLQVVRDQVFALLAQADFRLDFTILEKRKTMPHLQRDRWRFYKENWFLHFKYVAPRVVNYGDDLLMAAAALGTRKDRRAVRLAIQDVVNQSVTCKSWEVAFWSADSDPCLLVADYCVWAVQRKYERGDTRSYDLILDKIRSEFLAFALGTKFYY